jgi:hypothetical protein
VTFEDNIELDFSRGIAHAVDDRTGLTPCLETHREDPGWRGGDLPRDVAILGTTAYWSDDFGMFRCDLGACDTPSKLSPIEHHGGVLALDASRVYWADETPPTGFALVACPLGGCATNEVTIAHDTAVTSIAVDATNLYWTVGPGTDSASAKVKMCALSGCNDHPVLLAPQQTSQPRGLVSDGQYVYWADGRDQILRCSTADQCAAGPTVLASGQADPQRLALDAEHIYWTNHADGTVMSLAKPQ